jgi:amino-acid N-acetyltransferase
VSSPFSCRRCVIFFEIQPLNESRPESFESDGEPAASASGASPAPDWRLRASQLEDLPGIRQLLEPFVLRQVLLRRSREELELLISRGFVVESQAAEIVAFAAIEIYSRKLAEIQCLAVRDDFQHQGLGSRLVEACLGLADRHGVLEVMAISSSEAFLQRLGFDYALPHQKRALFHQLRSRESFDVLTDTATS